MKSYGLFVMSYWGKSSGVASRLCRDKFEMKDKRF